MEEKSRSARLFLHDPAASRLGRAFFARNPELVARELLGSVLVSGRGADLVAVRLTETEAYHGSDDPASHAYRGVTSRNAVMFGRAGHLYLYFVYGMHWCANIVTGDPGAASAVLLRAGEVLDGVDLAQRRRARAHPAVQLASGPARLATALGWGTSEAAQLANGADLCGRVGQPSISPVRVMVGVRPAQISIGPRVGVSTAVDEPLRFWITGDPTVSSYRPRGGRRQS